jgi:hypothetical protein
MNYQEINSSYSRFFKLLEMDSFASLIDSLNALSLESSASAFSSEACAFSMLSLNSDSGKLFFFPILSSYASLICLPISFHCSTDESGKNRHFKYMFTIAVRYTFTMAASLWKMAVSSVGAIFDALM